MSASLHPLPRTATLGDPKRERRCSLVQVQRYRAGAYDRILKVAPAIANLVNSDRTEAEHISEAIQYRTLERNLRP